MGDDATNRHFSLCRRKIIIIILKIIREPQKSPRPERIPYQVPGTFIPATRHLQQSYSGGVVSGRTSPTSRLCRHTYGQSSKSPANPTTCNRSPRTYGWALGGGRRPRVILAFPLTAPASFFCDPGSWYLTPLEPQSRFGDKLLEI